MHRTFALALVFSAACAHENLPKNEAKSSPPPTATTTATTTAVATTTTSTTTPCVAALTPEQSAKMMIEDPFFGADVVAGESRDLRLGERGPGSYDPFHPLDACATWSVDPPGVATIDAHGHLVVANDAAGKTFTVSAKLASGQLVRRTISVTAASLAALVGNWHEEGRQACGATTWTKPKDEIRELHLAADGSFGVTWHPFESYVDYWGNFTWNAASGAFAMTVSGGNYVPKDMKPSGTAKLENGALVLRGVWLGSMEGTTEAPACAQRFVK